MPPWKLWLFRVTALLGVPCFLLLLFEVSLRVTGFGYPTNFLTQIKDGGRRGYAPNNQFGWRFFGRKMSRAPHPFFLLEPKPASTIRIFIFGESAALGDPQPAFGMGRILQALLEARHPGIQFEVVNAAMTGINSHVILPLCQDCLAAEPDLWIFYMGNNEVVGPFGAGTVFGMQAPPRPLVRATIALSSLRAAQLIERIASSRQAEPDWGGLGMFMGHRLRADDAAMQTLYHSFAQNLADMLAAAASHKIPVVLSTVAANLRDCPPFASAHRAGLSSADLDHWTALWEQGVQAQASGDAVAASAAWSQAEKIDPQNAELRFVLGRLAEQAGDTNQAQIEFRAARDLDTLRFRCDSLLNSLVRTAAQKHPQIALADIEAEAARESAGGSPGRDLFYDHVHFTFAGNYMAGRLLAVQVEKLLVARFASPPLTSWPTMSQCAERLGWLASSRREAALEMLRRFSDPPFTLQLGHSEQMRQLQESAAKLSAAATPQAMNADLVQCRAAQARHPEDPELALELATLEESAGLTNQALGTAQHAVQLSPASVEAWGRLSLALEKQNRLDEAADACRRVARLDPEAFYAWDNLGRILAEEGRTNAAVSAYREAVRLSPRFSPSWLSLAELLERNGSKTESEACYSNAMAHPFRNSNELKRLAAACAQRGFPAAAATNYEEAARMDPGDIAARLHAGQNYATAGFAAPAERCFLEALQIAPESAPAHFLYGRALGRHGDDAGAEQQFREAIRLKPDLLEAHLNLALALTKEGRTKEAVLEYETVLERWPENPLARKNLEHLRSGTGENRN